MSVSLTIRLPVAQRKALRARASAAGKTESELVREIIAAQLDNAWTLEERAGTYFGRLDFEPASLDKDSWRAHQRRMNVRK